MERNRRQSNFGNQQIKGQQNFFFQVLRELTESYGTGVSYEAHPTFAQPLRKDNR